jgi:erythromycin esterase-like protein
VDHLGQEAGRARVVVWAHNSHLGDASATDMGVRGEWNLGQLCRESFGDRAFLVGFGTHHGTVAAAHEWDGPVRSMTIRPSHPQSYERLCHDAEVPAFFLHLREPAREEVRIELEPARLERAIGVLYRPDTELQSHYFHAVLPRQFDPSTTRRRAVFPARPRSRLTDRRDAAGAPMGAPPSGSFVTA